MRLVSNKEYTYIFLTLGVFTTLSGIFGNSLSFAETTSVSVVTILSLFLSEIEFKTEPGKALTTQVCVNFVAYALMHLHELVDWL